MGVAKAAVRALAIAAIASPLAGSASAAGGASARMVAIRGHINAFAQSRGYLAWLMPSRLSQCGLLVLEDLRTHARTRISRGDDCEDAERLLLADDRAYWAAPVFSNTYDNVDLMTASVRDRRIRAIGYQSISKGGRARPVLPASDGRSVYFWTSPADGEPGPVVRFDGLRRKRITTTLDDLHLLAAAEGRHALVHARWARDCSFDPSWSPGGERIAYVTCRGALRIIKANGTGGRQIAAPARHPDWSPSGSMIAYDDSAGSLVVVDADGSNRHVVADHASDPAWSPTGKELAFVRGEAIFVVGSDGTGERRLVDSALEPDWSPDGTHLVYARASPGHGLAIAGADGSAAHGLTADYDTAPAWSPDGRSIAFAHCTNAHLNCPDDALVIRAVRPDGSGARNVTPLDDERYDASPSWAADARRIVYASRADYQDDGDPHLYVAPGGRRLTHPPSPITPIVFYTRSGRVLRSTRPRGEAVGVAVTRTTIAALVRAQGSVRLEIYTPRRRTIRLTARPAHELAASGTLLVFRSGRLIYAVDARRGRPRMVARASASPIGLSIVGRRIAWAENLRSGARVRVVSLPSP
jgi:hypothetical protein